MAQAKKKAPPSRGKRRRAGTGRSKPLAPQFHIQVPEFFGNALDFASGLESWSMRLQQRDHPELNDQERKEIAHCLQAVAAWLIERERARPDTEADAMWTDFLISIGLDRKRAIAHALRTGRWHGRAATQQDFERVARALSRRRKKDK
jgi:hypothetical protein